VYFTLLYSKKIINLTLREIYLSCTLVYMEYKMKTKIFSKFVLSAAVVLCAGALMVGTADAKQKWGHASASNTSASLGVGAGAGSFFGGGIGGGFGVGFSTSSSDVEATGSTSGTAGSDGSYAAGGIGGGAGGFCSCGGGGGFAAGTSSSSASIN
jgi:hypothetical protein